MKMHATGNVVLWQGGSLWIGRVSGSTDTHVHHAMQVTIALEGGFQMKSTVSGDWKLFTGAIATSHQPHALRVTNAVLATIFVEPEVREGRILLDRFGGTGLCAIPPEMLSPAIGVLREVCESMPDDQALKDAAWEVVSLLAKGTRPMAVVDPRVLRAIELVVERLHGPILQEEIAAAVYLSPSRFRHLFVEETGMAFRPYILWMRLQRVLEQVRDGESLTNAAHEAGFSDLAHMSRTFKRMFGMTPATIAPDPDFLHRTMQEQPLHSNR